MKKFKYCITALLLFGFTNTFAQTITTVTHFNKIIISPHIQVMFVNGNEESVNVESCTVDKSKLHIEVNNNRLWLYLEGAKEFDKNEKDDKNGYKEKHSIYDGTIVTAVVTYKTLNELSIRGDEKQLCKSLITADNFSLRIYGQSQVIFNEVDLGELQTKMYGESTLEIKAGSINSQKYVAYGEGKINSVAINGITSDITTYGAANFRINASDEINIIAFGEAKLEYKGNPTINKGLHFGELHVNKID